MISYTDELSEDRVRLLRRLSPSQRLKIGMALTHFARQVKLDSLRRKFPELSEDELKRHRNEIFLFAKDSPLNAEELAAVHQFREELYRRVDVGEHRVV